MDFRMPSDSLKDYYDVVKLLSPPCLYGDRSAMGHNWEGEKANRAFVLSLVVSECIVFIMRSSDPYKA
jgi:hypothetical protein